MDHPLNSAEVCAETTSFLLFAQTEKGGSARKRMIKVPSLFVGLDRQLVCAALIVAVACATCASVENVNNATVGCLIRARVAW